MKVGGLQKLSLIDYPGNPAAVIFTQGCNMQCPYCHNPQLVYPELFEKVLSEEDLFNFLKKRQGVLKGIVITGGEPTIHADLPEFAKKIKALGYAIKIDTNGSSPDTLKLLIAENLIDFIAMDIKAPLQKYGLFYKGDIADIEKSINIIKSSLLPHQFRTTYDTDILDENDIKDIRFLAGSSEFVVQECIKRKKH